MNISAKKVAKNPIKLFSDCPAFDESVPSAPLFIKTPRDPSGDDEDGLNYSDDEFENDEPPPGMKVGTIFPYVV